MGKHKPLTSKRPAVRFEMGEKTPQGRRINFGSLWDYAPAPESTDHITIKPRYDLFINGKFVAPKSGKYFESINPATEEVLSEVAEADASDVDAAVKSVRRAFNGPWGKMKPSERSKYIFRVARMLQEKAREFAVIETMDGGKPINPARAGARRGHPARRRAFLLSRRLGGQTRLGVPWKKSRAARRVRTNHPVELTSFVSQTRLSVADGGVETRLLIAFVPQMLHRFFGLITQPFFRVIGCDTFQQLNRLLTADGLQRPDGAQSHIKVQVTE
jgi:hypothetical protein